MILRLIDWILRRKGFKRIPADARIEWVPFNVLQMTQEALELCVVEERKDLSGEYKRHQVYARMIKNHPNSPRKEISWAIERAVRNL